jgi:hypothetical protein
MAPEQLTERVRVAGAVGGEELGVAAVTGVEGAGPGGRT